MIIDNEFIPKEIISDLSFSDTKISINIGWEILLNNEDNVIVFHEKFGLLKHNKSDSEFKIVKNILSNKTTPIGDFNKNSLINLWLKGFFNISYNEVDGIILDKYCHFFEYLIRYGSKSLSPYAMFDNLQNSRVAIVGVGGLGSNVAVLLSSHGVGSITLIDGDVIEESNLTRQIFYKYNDIGRLKVDVLKEHITSNNPDTKVECISDFILSYDSAKNYLNGHDFVVLCADEPRFKIKAWVGQYCFDNGIPLLIMAGKWVGPILLKDKSPCYACLGRYHSSKLPYVKLALHLNNDIIPPRASFGPEPFTIAGYMAALVIKYLTGIDRETFLNKRMSIDFFGAGIEELVTHYIDCKICGSAVVVV